MYWRLYPIQTQLLVEKKCETAVTAVLWDQKPFRTNAPQAATGRWCVPSQEWERGYSLYMPFTVQTHHQNAKLQPTKPSLQKFPWTQNPLPHFPPFNLTPPKSSSSNSFMIQQIKSLPREDQDPFHTPSKYKSNKSVSRTMMSAYGVTFSLILLLFLANMVEYNEARVAQVSVLSVETDFDFTDPFSFLVKLVMIFCGYFVDWMFVSWFGGKWDGGWDGAFDGGREDGEDDDGDEWEQKEAGELPDMCSLHLLWWGQRPVLAISLLLCHQLQHSQ